MQPDIWLVFCVALVGYLIGNLSPARVLGRLILPGEALDNTKVVIPNSAEADIRYRGISATSVGAKLGPKWGIAIGLIDMAKAIVPMLIVMQIWPESGLHLVLAAMIMLGHNWPVFYGFHGGRGQSVLIGALLVISPLSPIVCYPVGIVVGLLLLKDMFTAYTLGQYLLIVWFLVFGSTADVLFAVAVNLIYSIAAIPEFMDYLAARKKGQVGQITSLREFFTAHPAMGEKRFSNDNRS